MSAEASVLFDAPGPKARRRHLVIAVVGSLGTEEVLRQFSTDAAIIAEPSSLDLIVAHRGFAWFEIQLTGRAAHGSQLAM